jgi:dynein heavy chain, axonemal
MNGLLTEIRQSLAELDSGLKGDLTMTEGMEALMASLASDCVPAAWAAVAYPSLRPLAPWLLNLLQRNAQLVE